MPCKVNFFGTNVKKIILLLALCTNFCVALTLKNNIESFKLDNGLKLYVIPDNRVPLAVFQIWYNVGASDEIIGKTGIAHVLEHMMFKGTNKYKNGEIWRIVESNGGSQNAFTSYDYTCYWQRFPADKIEYSFDIESDRMKNLQITEKDFSSEIKVVEEERRMRVDDNPNALASEQFRAMINVATPYQNPVIGWQRDLDRITVEDLSQWYKTWYIPNNAVVVVAGDVDPKTMYKYAQQYFGKIKAGPALPTKPTAEIPQLGKKYLESNVNAKLPAITLGFKAPSLKDNTRKSDVYALSMLSQLMTGGYSSALYNDLVIKKTSASYVDSYYSPFSKYNTYFGIYASPSPKVKVEELEKQILELITKIKTVPFSETDIKRAKEQLIAYEVYGKEKNVDKANYVGSLTSIGLSWQDYGEFFVSLQDVSAEDIMAVANKYFNDNNMVVSVVKPLKNTNKS